MGPGKPRDQRGAGGQPSVRHTSSPVAEGTVRTSEMSPLLPESESLRERAPTSGALSELQSSWLTTLTREQVSGLAELRKGGLEANAPPTPRSPAFLRPQLLEEGQNQENARKVKSN